MFYVRDREQPKPNLDQFENDYPAFVTEFNAFAKMAREREQQLASAQPQFPEMDELVLQLKDHFKAVKQTVHANDGQLRLAKVGAKEAMVKEVRAVD